MAIDGITESGNGSESDANEFAQAEHFRNELSVL